MIPSDAVGDVLAPTADQRLDLYLAPLPLGREGKGFRRYPVTPEEAFLGHPKRSFEVAVRRSQAYMDKKGLSGRNPAIINQLRKRYFDPVLEAHQRVGIMRRFQLVIGDDLTPNTSPTFHKARRIDDPGLSVLLPLNAERHFEPLAEVAENDIPFEEKASVVVWRGATTGVFWHPPFGSRYYIYQHWDRFARNPAFDFGFSRIVQVDKVGLKDDFGPLERCIKPTLSYKEQLAAKYLLVLEGNDLASGMKWILASNSLIIMPRIHAESWACESMLRPGVHYVEVRRDLEDLEDVYAWCEAHPAQCREIAENGKRFMSAFMDAGVERDLVDAVVKQYQKRVRLFMPENELAED
ncbi:lipopolysaccharide protein [Stappia sp. 22II-S9-Z10]|nr:lipopolysaccharide protein [Stappia sp. 22II-S9-Z10]